MIRYYSDQMVNDDNHQLDHFFDNVLKFYQFDQQLILLVVDLIFLIV